MRYQLRLDYAVSLLRYTVFCHFYFIIKDAKVIVGIEVDDVSFSFIGKDLCKFVHQYFCQISLQRRLSKDGLLMMSFHFLLFKSSRTLVSSAFKPFEKVSMKEMYFPISCLVNSLSSEGNKFKCSFKMVEYS